MRNLRVLSLCIAIVVAVAALSRIAEAFSNFPPQTLRLYGILVAIFFVLLVVIHYYPFRKPPDESDESDEPDEHGKSDDTETKMVEAENA